MSDSEGDAKQGGRNLGLTEKLTLKNWTQFKKKFLNVVKSKNKYCYSLLVKEKAPTFEVPGMNDMVANLNDEGEEVVIGGVVQEHRYFPDGREGGRLRNKMKEEMEKDEKTYKMMVPKIVAMLVASLSDEVIGSLSIDTKYDEAYEEDDLLAIWILTKFVATGEGADSIFIDITNFFDLKRSDKDWIQYTQKFAELAQKLLDRSLTQPQIINKIIDSFYIMGMRGFKPLELQIEQIMGKEDWPEWQKCVVKWRKIMTLKDKSKIKDDSDNGRINAMNANINTEDCGKCGNCNRGTKTFDLDEMNYIGACMSKPNRIRTANNTSKGEFPYECFNCGEVGHPNRRCPKKSSICTVCGQRHITGMHEKVMKSKEAYLKRKNERASGYKNGKTSSDSEDSMEAKLNNMPRAYKTSIDISEPDNDLDQWASAEALEMFENDMNEEGIDITDFNTDVMINDKRIDLQKMKELAGIQEEDLTDLQEGHFYDLQQYKKYKIGQSAGVSSLQWITNMAWKVVENITSNFNWQSSDTYFEDEVMEDDSIQDDFFNKN